MPPKKDNALRRNKDYLRNKTKKWREENPEKYKANSKRNEASRADRYRANPSLYLWRVAKSRAKKFNQPFDISPEDIVIPSKCPILGCPIDILTSNYATGASLDRVVNDKGYVKGNVRVISRKANRLKGDATIEEIINLLAYMRGEI